MRWLKKLHQRIFGYKDFFEEFPNYGQDPNVRNPHGKPMRLLRSPFGKCKGCGVDEKTWCLDDCPRLDPMDYR